MKSGIIYFILGFRGGGREELKMERCEKLGFLNLGKG
jgi:hypothetical protein